jgi:hypothetical protein
MSHRFLSVTCALLTVVATGCASVFNDKTQNVNVVTSNGRAAEVSIDGMPFHAPGVASFKRAKADKMITTRDPKCNQTTVAPSSIDNIFFVNIFAPLGVLSSTTDYASEKMWKYQDTVVISCKD